MFVMAEKLPASYSGEALVPRQDSIHIHVKLTEWCIAVLMLLLR